MVTRIIPLALLAASATFAACTYRDSNANAPENVRMVPTESAAVRIAQARCDIEGKCGRIGANMRYETAKECMGELMRDTEADLSPQICPSTVAATRVETCLNELLGESCEPLSPTRRMMMCDPHVLCTVPASPPYHPEEVYGP